ncbi:MAG: type IV secretory system conjugative DNA transfer family protein [Owenweeksia sp.]
MTSLSNNICYFAQTNFRNTRKRFGIRLPDRLYHFYITGKTGTGKTTLLHTKLRQDVQNGHGLCLIDVHGDLIKEVLKSIPEYRKPDITYLDATDPNLTLGYNPLRKVAYEKRPLIVSNILEVFQRLWGNQSWGVKLSHILRNVLLTLLDQPTASFSDVPRLLHDNEYRKTCLPHIINPDVKAFWEQEFKTYSKNDLVPLYNKLGAMLSYPPVKRILVENKEQISLRSSMDNQKILLVNLSKGILGSDTSYILGSLLLTSLSASAFSRADTPEDERQPFFVYLDEFQNYTNLSLVEMLSELRKYKVGMILAHQYIAQLDPQIRDAVLGNVGTIVTFRLGQADARYMENEFYPTFKRDHFLNLPNYHIYLKMMINGHPSKAFSATTLRPNQFES